MEMEKPTKKDFEDLFGKIKTAKDYLKLSYQINYNATKKDVVTCEVPKLKGCVSQGCDLENAKVNIKKVMYVWFIKALSANQAIPLPNHATLTPTFTMTIENNQFPSKINIIDVDKYKYSIKIRWCVDDNCFLATVPEFAGLSAFGETPEEALKEAKIVLGGFIEIFLEDNEKLPEPIVVK